MYFLKRFLINNRLRKVSFSKTIFCETVVESLRLSITLISKTVQNRLRICVTIVVEDLFSSSEKKKKNIDVV